MKFLLKHKDNNKIVEGVNLFDCPISLLNHFEQKKDADNTYIIDLQNYDELDTVIIKSIIKQVYELNSNSIIYIIGGTDFNFPNVHSVQSVSDVPS